MIPLDKVSVRSRCLSNVRYDLKLNLPQGQRFSGSIEISFGVTMTPPVDLLIDFSGLEVREYTVNDQNVQLDENAVFRGFIPIPTKLLRMDQTNTVKMYFLNKYAEAGGLGLVSYTNADCGQQFLKTKFETDFCHKIFPCFDQPDLLAKLIMSVSTDYNWTVITNEIERNDAS